MSNKWLVFTVVAMLAGTTFAAEKEAEIIASFEESDSMQNWKSYNDGVMGGRSRGGGVNTGQKTILFTGDISLENGGGFASIRSKPNPMNLDGASGLIVKARGDGRNYWVGLRTGGKFPGAAYRADLPTAKGEWTTTFIPISDFKEQVWGMLVPDSSPINPAGITSVGITLADKKAGPFEFELEFIKAVFAEANTKPTDSSITTLVSETPKPIAPTKSLTIATYDPPLSTKVVKLVEEPSRAQKVSSSHESMANYVYVQVGNTITVYDAEGMGRRSFTIPPEVLEITSFTILPDGGIAFLSNRNDAIYFVNKDGNHIKTLAFLEEPDRHIQTMTGIVVDGKLIVSSNGQREVIAVDLKTYELSVFRNLKQLKGGIGTITHTDGVFYISHYKDIYSFTADSEDITKVVSTPRGNVIEIIVENDQLFAAVNSYWPRPRQSPTVYEINLKSGELMEIKNIFNNPESLLLLKTEDSKTFREKFVPPVEPAAPTEDSLTIVSYDPPLPAELKAGEQLKVIVEYAVASVEQAQIWVRPLAKGKRVAGAGGHSSPFYKKGTGKFVGWFQFSRPAIVDEVCVRMLENRNAESPIISTTAPIQAEWVKK